MKNIYEFEDEEDTLIPLFSERREKPPKGALLQKLKKRQRVRPSSFKHEITSWKKNSKMHGSVYYILPSAKRRKETLRYGAKNFCYPSWFLKHPSVPDLLSHLTNCSHSPGVLVHFPQVDNKIFDAFVTRTYHILPNFAFNTPEKFSDFYTLGAASLAKSFFPGAFSSNSHGSYLVEPSYHCFYRPSSNVISYYKKLDMRFSKNKDIKKYYEVFYCFLNLDAAAIQSFMQDNGEPLPARPLYSQFMHIFEEYFLYNALRPIKVHVVNKFKEFPIAELSSYRVSPGLVKKFDFNIYDRDFLLKFAYSVKTFLFRRGFLETSANVESVRKMRKWI